MPARLISSRSALAEPSRANDGLGPVVPGACFLNSVFVVPERWGQGIGGTILDAVLAEAKRRRCSRISLWTAADDDRTRRLYRSHGFSPTGRPQHGQAEWAR
jgi:GNAT superfamily N-acetyltransferase